MKSHVTARNPVKSHVVSCHLISSHLMRSHDDDEDMTPPLTRDSILVAEQPELIHHTEHLDDVAGEEGQLLRDAGEKLKDRPHH